MEIAGVEAADQARDVFKSWKKLAGGFVLSSAALVLGAVVLLMSFLAASDSIRAKPTVEPTRLVVPTVQPATAEVKPKIDYYLPYPGILPDNPLYKLKAVRDKVSLWLTFDEEKKARKELLFADKRINAAVFLTEGGKGELGVTTATKAEKYLEQAVGRVTKMNKGGQDVKSVMMELEKASAKHIEILGGLLEKVTGEEKKPLEVSMATTKLGEERLKQMLLETK